MRKLLAVFEGTPLDMDMRSVLAKIAESLEGEISVEPEWLGEHVSVLAEDRVQVDPRPLGAGRGLSGAPRDLPGRSVPGVAMGLRR